MPIQMQAATFPFPFRKPFKNSNFKKKEINPKWLKYANSNKKRPGGIGISDGGFWIAEFRKCGFGQEVETRPRLGIGLSGRKTAMFFRPSHLRFTRVTFRNGKCYVTSIKLKKNAMFNQQKRAHGR